MALDRIMDYETEADQMAALGAIVKKINEQRAAVRGV
jgi:hypothetical protein